MPGKGIGISPYITTKKKGGGGVPTSTNATVQAWLNKIGTDGYAYPTQAQVDIYTTAWDYADAQGLTAQLDFVWLPKVENLNITKIPFLHPVANTVFDIYNETDLEINAAKGVRNSIADGSTYSGYYDLKLIPRTQLIKASQNNISAGIYTKGKISDSPGLSNFADFGAIGGGTISAANTPSGCAVRVCTTNVSSAPNVLDKSFVSAARVLSTEQKQYIDGSVVSTTVLSSSTLPNISIYGLNINSTAFDPNASCLTDHWLSFVFIGSGAINQAKMNTFVNLLLL